MKEDVGKRIMLHGLLRCPLVIGQDSRKRKLVDALVDAILHTHVLEHLSELPKQPVYHIGLQINCNSAATKVRMEFRIKAAQVTLGHTTWH